MTKGTIILYRDDHSGWSADFAAHSEGRKIAQLFGTTVLPLPWGAQASAACVIASLRNGNYPDAVITVNTCGYCGSVKPFGQSCSCFDNGGQ